MKYGLLPTAMVTVTEFVCASMMLTEWDCVLTTYTSSRIGFAEIPVGFWPTGIVATTPKLRPSMTETVLLPPFVTYTYSRRRGSLPEQERRNVRTSSKTMKRTFVGTLTRCRCCLERSCFGHGLAED